jgi:oxalate decarboxylase
LLPDWIAHTPPEVLAKEFRSARGGFRNIPGHNKWIYHSNIPAPLLPSRKAQIAAVTGKPPNPFVFKLGDMPPSRETRSGTVRIADSSNSLVSKMIAATQVTIR